MINDQPCQRRYECDSGFALFVNTIDRFMQNYGYSQADLEQAITFLGYRQSNKNEATMRALSELTAISQELGLYDQGDCDGKE